MKTHISNTLFPFLAAILLPASLNAACPSNIATSTVYNVPRAEDVCGSARRCEKFDKAVKTQGSGTVNGRMLKSNDGKTITEIKTECKTALGSGGCLTPFISVAADPAYYEIGDIISMPSLKGMLITMPDGTKLSHPGYFIVEDVGGAIKGENDFDFFIGQYQADDSRNSFSQIPYAGAPVLGDSTICTPNKKFTVIKWNDPVNALARRGIEVALDFERRYGTIERKSSVPFVEMRSGHQ